MNQLTEKEFRDRTEAVARARRIFINLTEGNITNAFILYQEVLAETERLEWITTAYAGNRPPALFDKYERPKCSECGADLMFRMLKPNDEGFKTQLVCSNPQCDTVFNSEMGIEEWEKELRRENGIREV